MAFKPTFYSLLVLLFLLLVVMEEASGCHTGHVMRCLYPKATLPLDIQGRKVLVVSKRSSRSNLNVEKLVVEELRTVPSGPDPLHHNGGNPKKPTTP
ncbi:protein CLAVATA 3 [Ricinus communis]|uniref:Uncharacterized protein n=1 Tax=Ricinus communis TaxID=3988 RepID=B9SD09_RICCO|nr:protein CLAVATA 3 [Ricinus communis]EEF38604.1 conserved hypothetical protein [Ricinus communis]|eukprot:XP_025013965.1 protein CLAVATA 3 [Ricinus communis]